jgi:hypothetical protein
VALGVGAGVLFAATGGYTKEIGDRVAIHGLPGIGLAVASPSPWVMLAFTVLAQSYLQTAFRQVNAATVSATNTAVSMNGLIRVRLRPLPGAVPERRARSGAGPRDPRLRGLGQPACVHVCIHPTGRARSTGTTSARSA